METSIHVILKDSLIYGIGKYFFRYRFGKMFDFLQHHRLIKYFFVGLIKKIEI